MMIMVMMTTTTTTMKMKMTTTMVMKMMTTTMVMKMMMTTMVMKMMTTTMVRRTGGGEGVVDLLGEKGKGLGDVASIDGRCLIVTHVVEVCKERSLCVCVCVCVCVRVCVCNTAKTTHNTNNKKSITSKSNPKLHYTITSQQHPYNINFPQTPTTTKTLTPQQ